MNEEIKLIWFIERNTNVCYPCKYPYERKDIILEGIEYEKWLKLIKDKK